jgi:hypothetical protein
MHQSGFAEKIGANLVQSLFSDEKSRFGLFLTERDNVSFLAPRVVPRNAGSNPAKGGISADAPTVTT